jgi:Mo-dependent nitrogenase C-terminus
MNLFLTERAQRKMSVSNYTTNSFVLASWVWPNKPEANANATDTPDPVVAHLPRKPGLDLLRPLRRWLDNLEVRNPELARSICQFIPAQCPFERDIKVFGRTVLHIPPMCKLNPVYEEVVGLRFRALCYLADECGEDVTRFC